MQLPKRFKWVNLPEEKLISARQIAGKKIHSADVESSPIESVVSKERQADRCLSNSDLWKRRHGQLSIHSLAPEEKNRGDTIDH